MSNLFTTRLTSARLTLRRLQAGDEVALCSYRSMPEVARFQSWESFGPEDATRLIASQATMEPGVAGTWFQLAIVERVSELMIGDCALHSEKEDPRRMEVGITLAPGSQKKGYAAEALNCLMNFAFATLEAHRISAVTDTENGAAASLFQRLGFRKEAHFIEHRWYKGYWDSEFVFGLLRREWQAGK